MVSLQFAEHEVKATPTRRRPRICLVVDSPLRDLEGITLVAWHLARQGADPVLVPMYEQGFEVLGLCPDAVLVNYARSTNRFLLEAYREAGIAVSVLDTEGGVVDSLEDYASSVKCNGTVPFLDQMMIWGPLQAAAFEQYSGFEASQLVLTGCPRMDFCAEPWRAALPLPDKVTAPIVLINTNFSLVNPRFSRSVEKELATTVAAGFSGWDEGYVQELAAGTRSGFDSMIATARLTAERMPHIQFVVRPHPFESITPYERALAHLSNVQVRLEGSVAAWLRVSAAVVHLNCGSAVEAALMGVPALSLEWLNSEVLIRNAPIPRELSVHVHSAADLAHKLDLLTRGESLSGDDVTRQRTLNVLEQWFYKSDGRAAERVASGLLDLVERTGRTPSAAKCRRLGLIGGKRHQPLVGLADGLGRVVLGRWHAWMRTNVLTGGVNRSARRAKSFTARQIEQILQRINTVAGLDAAAIVPARVRRSEGNVPGLSSSAVRLVPVSPP